MDDGPPVPREVTKLPALRQPREASSILARAAAPLPAWAQKSASTVPKPPKTSSNPLDTAKDREQWMGQGGRLRVGYDNVPVKFRMIQSRMAAGMQEEATKLPPPVPVRSSGLKLNEKAAEHGVFTKSLRTGLAVTKGGVTVLDGTAVATAAGGDGGAGALPAVGGAAPLGKAPAIISVPVARPDKCPRVLEASVAMLKELVGEEGAAALDTR